MRRLRFDVLALVLVLATVAPAVPVRAEGTATLTLEVRGNGSGVVTAPVDGLACRDTCAATLPAGTTVSLVATADPGSAFVGWGGACSGADACEVVLDADRSVVARFDDTLRPGLMIRRSGGFRGRWVVDPSAGEAQTVSAKAGRGERVTFTVRVVNDGLVADRIVLEGTGDRGGAAVTYVTDGRDVTEGVVAGTLALPELAPGRAATVRILVDVAATAKIGAERAWTLHGRSAAEPASADAVRAEVRVVWRPVPLARGAGVTLVEPGRQVALVAYHQSLFGSAVALDPLGGGWVVMDSRGRDTPATSAVDVVMDVGEPVLAPVTGRVVSVTPYRVYCDVPDVRIVLRPVQDRTRTVLVLHVREVRVSKGDRVEAGRTVLGLPRDLGYHDQVDDYGAAGRPHVHLEIEGDGSSPLPGCL